MWALPPELSSLLDLQVMALSRYIEKNFPVASSSLDSSSCAIVALPSGGLFKIISVSIPTYTGM